MRAVREFRAEPLRDADMRAILEAGRRTGSSKNLQRWRFVVVNDRARLRDLSAVGPWAGHLVSAGTAVALVTPDPHAANVPLSVTWDSGRAAQSMMLVAWTRGVGSVPATVYEHELCREVLGYPSDRHCEYILNFGYPADARVMAAAPRAGGRLALDDVVFYERWGATAPDKSP